LEAGKKIYERRCLEIDPEGGEGPAWTVEPVEREFIICDIEQMNSLHRSNK
jgi:hypothetical protein